MREGRPLALRQQTALTLQLSFPAILAQISSIVMQYIDAAMVGQLGRDASAAIGLVASSTWLFGGLCRALVVGFSVMVAQRIGAGEEKDARNLVKQGLCAGFAFGLLIAAVGGAIASGLPHWLHADSSICPGASSYFLIFALSLPFVQLNRLAVGLLQAGGNMRTPSILLVASALMYALAPWIIGMLSPARQVVLLGTQVLRIVVFSEPLFGASIVTAGVFQGAGSSLLSSVLNFVSMWGVRITLTFAASPSPAVDQQIAS